MQFQSESGIFKDESGIFEGESGIFKDESGIFEDESGGEVKKLRRGNVGNSNGFLAISHRLKKSSFVFKLPITQSGC
jgi:hypothetical protein